jgi:hypothetical protein
MRAPIAQRAHHSRRANRGPRAPRGALAQSFQVVKDLPRADGAKHRQPSHHTRPSPDHFAIAEELASHATGGGKGLDASTGEFEPHTQITALERRATTAGFILAVCGHLYSIHFRPPPPIVVLSEGRASPVLFVFDKTATRLIRRIRISFCELLDNYWSASRITVIATG